MPTHNSAQQASLRLWPGIVLVTLQWTAWVILPLLAPGLSAYGIIAAIGCGVLVVVWWLFFSRAAWIERLGAIALMVAGVAATSLAVHQSISNGMMGMMLPFYSIPVLSLALIGWAVIARGFGTTRRWATLAAAIAVACGAFTLIRTGGITGEGESDLHWRWTPTPEQRLLADERLEPVPAPPASAATAGAQPQEQPLSPVSPPEQPRAAAPTGEQRSTGERQNAGGTPAANAPSTAAPTSTSDGRRPEWPGFRGPERDGIVRGAYIETNWQQHPPVEMWRRPIGPGWSSFAVAGDLIYTQEQRGDDEVVSCYRLSTGEPVWHHRDPVRFWESNGGAGPRATPTIHNGRVYAMGATGIVNVLDASTGALIWSRNAATDTKREIPDWGLSASPLVVDDVVIVAVAGQLAAYDSRGGAPRWMGEAGGGGYSSPHLAIIGGVPQVLLLRGARTISVAPADGTLLWEDRWQPAVSIVQPALAENGDVLIASGDAMGGLGLRRLSVAHGADGWTVQERWISRGLKPYFNDMVIHKGHAFGFDGSILAAIDLADGSRKWKGGRYGHGQMILLPEQDLLLVLSEDGEIALVNALPDRFTEVARRPALDAKTWNHPVLVGDVLLVRNGEEMVAFRMSNTTR